MNVFLKACNATLGIVLTLVLCYSVWSALPDSDTLPRHVNVPVAQMSTEQRASHMITYLDKKGKSVSLCSGTAIGPHSLLTAAHCNDGTHDDPSDTITIDLSSHKYSILAVTGDDRDHEIYLVDGPAFTVIAPYVQSTPKPGEHVVFYGFGEAVYPSTVRAGFVRPNDDPSDVDAETGFFTLTFAPLHGDSGSAIFDDKGEIVGLVTYVLPWYNQDVTGVFTLNFTQDKIDIAQHFNPDDPSTYPGASH